MPGGYYELGLLPHPRLRCVIQYIRRWVARRPMAWAKKSLNRISRGSKGSFVHTVRAECTRRHSEPSQQSAPARRIRTGSIHRRFLWILEPAIDAGASLKPIAHALRSYQSALPPNGFFVNYVTPPPCVCGASVDLEYQPGYAINALWKVSSTTPTIWDSRFRLKGRCFPNPNGEIRSASLWVSRQFQSRFRGQQAVRISAEPSVQRFLFVLPECSRRLVTRTIGQNSSIRLLWETTSGRCTLSTPTTRMEQLRRRYGSTLSCGDRTHSA